jgi:uncharacterized FAD-dependent dehydrogenase
LEPISYPNYSGYSEKIIECGGQVLFETRVMDIVVKNNEVQGIVTKKMILANKMILATGHSARDIFELLDRKNIHRSESFRFRGERNIHNP